MSPTRLLIDGPSVILNPKGPYYRDLKAEMDSDYEDNFWVEDALYMERNSRDFVTRNARINVNAEAICNTLKASTMGQCYNENIIAPAKLARTSVKDVYYPKWNSTCHFYDRYRNSNGGYGGLLSVTFRKEQQAVAFYDALDTAKGPSLGTNFTLRLAGGGESQV